MTLIKQSALVAVIISVITAAQVHAQQPVIPPPPQTPYGAPITLEHAKRVMARAEAEANSNKWNVTIAIFDSGGNLVMLHRLDGAQLASTDVAQDKARSAVLFRRPTKWFQDQIAQGGAGLKFLKLNGAIPLEGGIPIVVDGKIIGSVGVSGASSEQDAQIAKAGADAVTK